jgi:hypothetical protein
VTVALGAVGCTDPAVGDWEASTPCGDSEFTIDDEDGLAGDGTLRLADGVGNCIACDFDVELDDPDDGKYEGTVELKNDGSPGSCTCGPSQLTKLDVECDINDDGDALDCSLECVGDEEFDKKE